MRGQYEHFGEETAEHVERLEQLIVAADGDPQYVSGAARATEKAAAGLLEATFLLQGSSDPVTAEWAMWEAVMLAEAKDRHNWVTLANLATQMTEGTLRTQFETVTGAVLQQEQEHYSWASETRAALLMSMAVPGGTAKTAESQSSGEWTRDELYARAQELAIAGRSQMTKDELREAVETRRVSGHEPVGAPGNSGRGA